MHVFPVTLEIDDYPVSLLVVQFAQEQTIEALFDAVYNGFTDERLQANAIIIRPDVRDQFSVGDVNAACNGAARGNSAFLDALAAAIAEPEIHFGRFPSLPIYVLHTDDFQPVLSDNINPDASAPDLIASHMKLPVVIDEIRNAEMR